MHLINYVTRIQMDYGSLRVLPEEMERLGFKRPLIVTDAGIVDAGLLDRLTATIGGSVRCAVYDRTSSNPTERQVDEAAELFRSFGCDGLIGIGGGSPLDLAKGVAIRVTHEGPLASYCVAEGGRDKIGSTVPAVIAIPTTSGTGSEVSAGALIILNDGRKLVFGSPHLIPKSAICDPDLTLGLPPGLTAATGMDAIAHCIETFLSPRFNPPAEGIALDGLERAWTYIERACADGSDREARLYMMSASLQGALAFQKGLGAVHALSHPLGAVKIDGKASLHHGTLNAMVLPAVLRFNADAPGVIEQRKYRRLARAMGRPQDADPAEAILEMIGVLKMPAGLARMGITPAMLPDVARAAVLDASHGTNPIAPTEEDYLRMLEESMSLFP
ncbi:MAG: iron-containing alcohol dehydrogenase [Burkholderiaceae bacterium]